MEPLPSPSYSTPAQEPWPSLPAQSSLTMSWLREGTSLNLVHPQSAESYLASLRLRVQSSGSSQTLVMLALCQVPSISVAGTHFLALETCDLTGKANELQNPKSSKRRLWGMRGAMMLPGMGEGVPERCLLGWPMSERKAMQMGSHAESHPMPQLQGSHSLGAFLCSSLC